MGYTQWPNKLFMLREYIILTGYDFQQLPSVLEREHMKAYRVPCLLWILDGEKWKLDAVTGKGQRVVYVRYTYGWFNILKHLSQLFLTHLSFSSFKKFLQFYHEQIRAALFYSLSLKWNEAPHLQSELVARKGRICCFIWYKLGIPNFKRVFQNIYKLVFVIHWYPQGGSPTVLE